MKKAREKIQAHPNRWQVVVYVEDDARVCKENWAELILDSLYSSAKSIVWLGYLKRPHTLIAATRNRIGSHVVAFKQGRRHLLAVCRLHRSVSGRHYLGLCCVDPMVQDK